MPTAAVMTAAAALRQRTGGTRQHMNRYRQYGNRTRIATSARRPHAAGPRSAPSGRTWPATTATPSTPKGTASHALATGGRARQRTNRATASTPQTTGWRNSRAACTSLDLSTGPEKVCARAPKTLRPPTCELSALAGECGASHPSRVADEGDGAFPHHVVASLDAQAPL